jgi:D-hexose-6-phosphate mutarotase
MCGMYISVCLQHDIHAVSALGVLFVPAISYQVELAWLAGAPHSQLTCRLSVKNTQVDVPLTFTSALHTYFAVSEIAQVPHPFTVTASALSRFTHISLMRVDLDQLYMSQVSVGPVRGLSFLDQLQKDAAGQPTRCHADHEVVVFDKETDAIYADAFQNGHARTLQIIDPAARRQFEVSTENFSDAVVWNAWEKKAATMADMEPGGWVCRLHASGFAPCIFFHSKCVWCLSGSIATCV